MKKLNIKLYASLVFGLLSTYILLSFWWFNTYTIENENMAQRPFLYFVLNLMMYFGIVLFAKNITRKEIKQINDSENSDTSIEKARRKALIIFNSLFFIMVLGLFYYAYGEFAFIYTGTRETYSLVEILLPIVASIVSLVPGSILLNSVFKYKENNNKVLRVVKYLGLVIFIVFLFGIDVFVLVPINEFKYTYSTYGDEFDINEFIYKDIRDWYYSAEYDIPEKIWGKNVNGLGGITLSDNTKTILIPSDTEFSDLVSKISNFDLRPNINSIVDAFTYTKIDKLIFDKRIKIKGEPKEWYIKDDIIYSKDNTKIFIYRNLENNTFEIGESIEKIYPKDFTRFINSDTQIIISEKNPYFYEYGNVIWSKENSSNINSPIHEIGRLEQIDVAIIKTINNSKPIDITISPKVNNKILLFNGMFSNVNKIIIPKEFSYNDFGYQIPITCDAYEVEEGNPYYTTYDGNLYSKDLTKLYAIRKYEFGEKIKFPEEIKEISDNAIEQLKGKESLLKDAENIIWEKGFIYTKNYDRVLSFYTGQATYYSIVDNSSNGRFTINKNTKEISDNYDTFGKGYNWTVEIDPENQYLIKHGCGIFTSDNKKLVNIDRSKEDLIIPEELVEIDEDIFNKISRNKHVYVSKNNQFYETDFEQNEQPSGDYLEGNALFTKGKEKLIYGSPTIIPKETKEISKAVINNCMIETEIECDENNPYFESYKGNLYTKGRKELLCIGELEDRTLIIAKETTSINKEMLESFVNIHNLDDSEPLFNYVIEEGNNKYGTYDGNLYEDNYSRLLLYNAIQESAPQEFLKSKVHPDCKYIDDIAFNCIGIKETYVLDVSENKYMSYAGYYIEYYPEYKYLNLDK